MVNGWLLAAFWLLVLTALVASHYVAYLYGRLSILRRNAAQEKDKCSPTT